MARRHGLAVLVTTVGLVAIAGCAGGGDDNQGEPPATRATLAPRVTLDDDVLTPVGSAGATPSTAAPRDYAIGFSDLGGGVDAGWLTVPLDYDDPNGATIDLWVVRHRASGDERIGVLFANNGGPGVPASSMAASPADWFESDIVDRFDIVAWDPRGTGQSSGVDCIGNDAYDRLFSTADVTPDDAAEQEQLVELAREFADACIAADGAELPYLGTNNSARDMDAIRQALGESQASFLGYSYGSELGAVWATLFPDTVRAAVLDGARHPDVDSLEPIREQRAGFDAVLSTFLADCSATSSCAFNNDGDAEGAFDALMVSIDENPLPSADGRPPVNLEVALTGVIQAMYSDRTWPALERALDDAQNGDGAGLLALRDAYYRRSATGEYSNLIEAFQAISCADESERLTVDEADDRAAELYDPASRLFPYTSGSYTCGFFPPSADARAEITGERAGPILVIGTTGDASTPLDSSRAMADALEGGELVVLDANRHTAYRSNECINDVVHQYLIWLEPPAPDTVCS